MKKLDQYSLSSSINDNNNGHLKQLLFGAATLSLLLLLLIVLVFGTSSSSSSSYGTTVGGGAGHSTTFSHTNINYRNTTSSSSSSVASKGRHHHHPVVLAYWIYGSSGDGDRILRLLKATYHPRNHYLLFLDSSSSSDERARLALSVQSHPLFAAFDNVDVVGRAYAVNQMGGSGLSALLHASALLLKLTTTTWDWFIPLSASHYPLMTQDDILLAFTSLPRDLNFVHFTNMTTQSHEDVWVKQVVVDPSVYNIKTGPVFKAKETRNPPNTFKILQGSPWVILSRSLIDFCVKGWDNFPRKLLMYMTNLASPLEFYFQTLICNSPHFHNTTIDNHLRYVMTKSDFGKEVLSKAREMPILAAPFNSEDDAVLLQEIDKNLLNRSANGVVPGKWCLELKTNETTNITETKFGWRWGDINSVEATPRGVKLGLTLSRLATEGLRRFDGCPAPNNVLKR